MEKASFIRKMFEDIAFSYDLQNSILSLRRDVAWRKVLVRSLRIPSKCTILDAATGTGEVTIEIVRQKPGVTVVGTDISLRMLAIGGRKVKQRKMENRVHLSLGDCRRLPFPGASFAAVSMAFGIRNIDERMQVLREFLRVLKPGGQLLIMEFGYPEDRLLRMLYELYFNHVLPPLGNWLSRTDYAYSYLVESVQSFPDEEAFLGEIEEAGFTGLSVRKLTFGIARIYSGSKPFSTSGEDAGQAALEPL